MYTGGCKGDFLPASPSCHPRNAEVANVEELEGMLNFVSILLWVQGSSERFVDVELPFAIRDVED